MTINAICHIDQACHCEVHNYNYSFYLKLDILRPDSPKTIMSTHKKTMGINRLVYNY
jgi:hypothetical protein